MATLSILDFEGELPLSQGKVTGKVTKNVIHMLKKNRLTFKRLFDTNVYIKIEANHEQKRSNHQRAYT